MINTKNISINPFERAEFFPSYKKNIGELYPAFLIKNTDKIISIYDGVLTIRDLEIPMYELSLADVFFKIKEASVDVKMFTPGMETVTALSLVDFSNVDVSEVELVSSPMSAAAAVSNNIAPNIPGAYLDMVDISIDQTQNVKLHNGLIISSSNLHNTKINVKHFAKTFILYISESNIIRNIKDSYKLPQVRNAVINYNLETFGAERWRH